MILLWLAVPASAIDIPVDLLGDPIPNGCTPGDCSLREAVILANSIAGPDRILLPATPGVPLQLAIAGGNENASATGDLDVLDDLEIVGTGVATTRLVQTAADRVLQTMMASTGRLVLRGLTIEGGGGVSGGGLSTSALVTIEDAAFVGHSVTTIGGAIDHSVGFAPEIVEPRLVLRRVRFEDNAVTESTAGFGTGGAVHVSSFITSAPVIVIEDCEFTGNESTNGGGAVSLTGAPSNFGGSVVIRRSVFDANLTGGAGGAAILARNSSFVVRIEDSRFEGNLTTDGDSTAGGAIQFGEVASAELLRTTFLSNSGTRGGALQSNALTRVFDSHFSGNTAAIGGGAVWATRDLLAERSTFAANRVTSTSSADPGGGAIGYSGFNGAYLGVQRSTFSGNDAYRGGAISIVLGRLQLYGSTLVAPAFGMAGSTGTVLRILDDTGGNPLAIANSILAGSCTFPSAERRLAVAYNNIESTGNSCRFADAVASAQNQVSASSGQIALAGLAANGGPTQTRMPGAASIAINQGRESHCTATDQRHYARGDALCDIGAVERGAIPDELFRNGFD